MYFRDGCPNFVNALSLWIDMMNSTSGGGVAKLVKDLGIVI